MHDHPPITLLHLCMRTFRPRTCRSTATDPAARTRSPIDHMCGHPLWRPHICQCFRCGPIRAR